MSGNLRVGLGYDIHRLTAGRPLWLGGVEIPSEVGLLGHSDGDVLLHAVGDALLGATGLGELGTWFPSSDEAYKGIASRLLLEQIGDQLGQAGWQILSIDSVVIAESPRLAPYRETMCANIAHALHLEPSVVNVKPRTNEQLGPVGAGEAIAAQAVALVTHGGSH